MLIRFMCEQATKPQHIRELSAELFGGDTLEQPLACYGSVSYSAARVSGCLPVSSPQPYSPTNLFHVRMQENSHHLSDFKIHMHPLLLQLTSCWEGEKNKQSSKRHMRGLQIHVPCACYGWSQKGTQSTAFLCQCGRLRQEDCTF